MYYTNANLIKNEITLYDYVTIIETNNNNNDDDDDDNSTTTIIIIIVVICVVALGVAIGAYIYH